MNPVAELDTAVIPIFRNLKDVCVAGWVFVSTTQVVQLQQLIDQLDGEHFRAVLWAGDMGISQSAPTEQDLKRILTREDLRRVHDMSRKVESAYAKASEQLAALNFSFTSARSSFRKKLSLEYVQSCEDLLRIVGDMNDLLHLLAPPPLPQYGSEDDATDHQHNQGVLQPLSGRLVDVDLEPSISSGSIHPNGYCLTRLFGQALGVIKTLAERTNSKELSKIAHRLRIWGYSLFDSAASLDVVLSTAKEHDSQLGLFVQSALIEILILEGLEMNKLRNNFEGALRREIEKLEDDIRLLLFEDEYLDAALMSSDLVLSETAEQWLLIEDTGRSEQASELNEHGQHDAKDPGSVPTLIKSLMAEAVERLFDLLPELTVARKTWCLRQESSHSTTHIAQQNKQVGNTLATTGTRNLESLVESNVFRMIPLERDTKLQVLDIKVALQARDMKTHQTKAHALDGAFHAWQKSVSTVSEPEIKQMQQIIGEFVHQSQSNSSMTESVEPSYKTRDQRAEETSSFQDIKLPLGQSTDVRIDDFIQRIARFGQS